MAKCLFVLLFFRFCFLMLFMFFYAFLFFMSDHIFVLSEKNSDLVAHRSFQKKKKYICIPENGICGLEIRGRKFV